VSLGDAEDRRLAAAVVASRDETAFRTLYRRHTPALYRLALRLGGGNEHWAEELVQQAWIRAVEGLATFQWRAAFRTWLSGIAVNCARERWREERVSPEVAWEPDAHAVAGAGPDPADRVDLERGIAALPHGCRQVLVLHDVEGFTHEEVGRMLGIETGTSKSQLSHARRRLREYLNRSGPRLERRGNG
jgi:RNA polymerase sigma-70 factor (ECF subfamily)